MRQTFLSTLLLGISLSTAGAAVRLPQILSSHGVLQRGQPIHVWGWADAGEKVSVSFAGTNGTATADRLGHWSLYLPAHAAGGPFDLTVSGSSEVKVEDLLVGDVWFASGQSNMEMPLNGFPGSAVIQNSAQEISAATHPDIRLLYVPKHPSPYPLNEFEDKVAWTLCTPETAAKFSAVAYFFGRDVAAAEHVPIGLIDSTWGGTPAEAWTSLEGLGSNASLMPTFAAFAKMTDEQANVGDQKKADQREDEAARKAHQPLPTHHWRGDLSSWTPAWLFNGMVAPATGYAIKGAIWYQGEANTDAIRAPLYGALFQEMITDWRSHWHVGEFPFFYVQIANFATGPTALWPTVREGQRHTLQLVNTGMAVTIDIGDPNNIHPANKQAVGARLARAARAVAYGETIPYTGPLFERATAENGSMRVWFRGAQDPLQPKGGDGVQGFEIAGDNRQFLPGVAKIDGATVVVSNAQIERPRYVRYGWQNAPVLNLFDSAGLPASPFTSDDSASGR